eukprot:14089454-Alexandrium_andersonii.AAC.1
MSCGHRCKGGGGHALGSAARCNCKWLQSGGHEAPRRRRYGPGEACWDRSQQLDSPGAHCTGCSPAPTSGRQRRACLLYTSPSPRD